MKLSELLKQTRQYFWGLNFTEVEPTYLNSSLPLEPNLYSFQTGDYFLPTSPEIFLKNHLAKHQTNCFSISHCFRNLESVGPQHKPEFLMLEYYLVNQNLADLQESLKKYLSLFQPLAEDLRFKILNLPTNLPTNEPDFNQYFLNEIEPSLHKDKAVFITGYPAFLSPLAKFESSEVNNFLKHSDREQARAEPEGSEHSKNLFTSKRFELYINGIEIANGCEENTDGEQIKSAFKEENDYRLKNNLPIHPISTEFIENCTSLPPCAGVGIGLDRLLMVINHQNSL